ncbi:MAG: RdgB/HAM1 family non-canonical purine NTP pyrophosphatase [Acidimicrobiales bacterium]
MTGSPSTGRFEPVTLVLASANLDKSAEIRQILGAEGIELRPRPAEVPDVEETGSTLVENARLKARAICSATAMAAVADDTGLEVEALGGAPGVYSARYAGEDATYADNVAKLVEALGGVSEQDRGARFTTVALVAFPDGSELSAEGAVEGRIVEVPRGSAGFGYDSVFVPHEGDGRTYAEMSTQEKNALSHRSRAFRSLAKLLGPIDR